jgi:hypothetical protein
VRRDVYGHDALAWALFKAGDLAEASREATAALALGTPDPRLAYHAALIFEAGGGAERALPLIRLAVRGITLLPPLQQPLARAALSRLEGEQ